MAERRILYEQTVKYEGLFDAKAIYKIIDDYFATKSYDKEELENRELVSEKGKDIHIQYQPYKKVSDYFKIIIKIDVDMRNVTDVETEIDGKRKHLKKGSVSFTIKPMLESDYEGRWEQRPMYYLIRTVFDKFIYRRQTADFESMAKEDADGIKERLGSYLNLQRYRKQ